MTVVLAGGIIQIFEFKELSGTYFDNALVLKGTIKPPSSPSSSSASSNDVRFDAFGTEGLSLEVLFGFTGLSRLTPVAI